MSSLPEITLKYACWLIPPSRLTQGSRLICLSAVLRIAELHGRITCREEMLLSDWVINYTIWISISVSFHSEPAGMITNIFSQSNSDSELRLCVHGRQRLFLLPNFIYLEQKEVMHRPNHTMNSLFFGAWKTCFRQAEQPVGMNSCKTKGWKHHVTHF